MRLLALTKYDMLAAATRQRFRLYEPALNAAGFSVDYAPLLENSHVSGLTSGRRTSVAGLARAYAARMHELARAGRYDGLWVHYELFPFLPGLFERLAGLHGQPLIVDYDDATFDYYAHSRSPLVRYLLGRKLEPLLRGATACCCGNAYIKAYTERFCDQSTILPTVVDTNLYLPASKRPDRPITIGWIGSPSTYVLVPPLLPLLRDLAAQRGVRVRVVGAGKAAERDQFAGLDLVEWSEASEIADVQAMDIGIMPLQDLPFQRGKCGYKLIQYMACGLPVVASPVGVNAAIVDDGVTGLLAIDLDQWRDALNRLIDDADLRAALGQAGRRRAVEDYSLDAHAPRLVEVIRGAVAKGRTSR